MYVRGDILFILLGALKWVLLNGIQPNRYQMKAKDLFFDMISKFFQKVQVQYHKNGDEKSFATYFCTKVDL